MLNDKLLSDKVAIITGGASGIGRATAELFVQQGARIVIADINEDAGQLLANHLGDAAFFKQTDVSNAEQIQALVDFTVNHCGALDVIYNNAGIWGAVHQSFLSDDLADFERVISINLFGTLIGCQTAARYMAQHGGGSIINTSSLAALKPGLPLISYRAAKAGVIKVTECIARELGVHGVRVNCIAPGHIPAGMTFYDISARIKKRSPYSVRVPR